MQSNEKINKVKSNFFSDLHKLSKFTIHSLQQSLITQPGEVSVSKLACNEEV